MTRLIAGLAMVAALAVAGCAGGEADADPYIFILSGQSNMVGSGQTSELPAELTMLPETIELYVEGEPAQITDRPRFGPEVAFAHEMAAAWPDRNIVLVKFAVGGTSLLAWAPQWSEEEAGRTQNAAAGPLFSRLLEYSRVDLGPSARFAALLWMQGERDARYADIGPDYLGRLDAMVTTVRTELEAPDLPLLLGLVNPPIGRYPAADVVRAQQRAAVDLLSATSLVETDDLSKLDDNLHYDTAGQLELGRRFAEAFLAAAR